MSCRVVKVKSEVAQESGRVRSDHISSSLYEARREASLCNNNTLLSACQKSLAEENLLYGITYMATPDNEATCYVKTKMANHVPVGSVLSYQLALTEADFQVELNEVSMNRFLCVLTTGVYPKFPIIINEIQNIYYDNNLSSEVKKIVEKLTLTEDECHAIELSTRDQANCDTWWLGRRSRLTSSNFGEIFKRKKTDCSKFIEIINNQSRSTMTSSAALKHGRQYERMRTFAITWMRNTSSAFICFLLPTNAGMFTLTPKGSAKSWIWKPLSTSQTAPLLCGICRKPDLKTNSLSDIFPVYNWEINPSCPEGVHATKPLTVLRLL